MKKRILGLDVGTASIGWALVNECEDKTSENSIEKIGTRVIPLTADEKNNFEKGQSFSETQVRTEKRGARRNLQRYTDRRNKLLLDLTKAGLITEKTVLTEVGSGSTYQLWELRAKAATEQISLEAFARVLLAINKKRGYKSNRKAKGDEDGQVIDGMEVAITLYKKQLTPGQYVSQNLSVENKHVPDFYPSDLQAEFDQIWAFQKQHYGELTDTLKQELIDKNKSQTWAILKQPLGLVGTSLVDADGKKLKGFNEKCELYRLRSVALSERLEPEHLAIVLQQINNQKKETSGYLGEISDRSKELYFNNQTVGQWSYTKLKSNPHSKVRKKAFYRQDYLDEFEKIWEKQRQYYPEILSDALKSSIRDTIIFYQRPLRSQKGLIGICELESKMKIMLESNTGQPIIDEKTREPKKKLLGPRVIPRANPLFQEFKYWQTINNLEICHKNDKKKYTISELDEDLEMRQKIANELETRGRMTSAQILKILTDTPKKWELNFKEGIQGNTTNEELYKAYHKIIELTDESVNFNKHGAGLQSQLATAFGNIGIDTAILDFNSELEGQKIEQQASWQLWHLLYSYSGDNSTSGNEALCRKLKRKFGFQEKHAKIMATVSFKEDYGRLSARAIRKILPFLKSGNGYAEACSLAGYRHSGWTTAEEQQTRTLKDEMEILAKNSLRNPVVEKILNQTAHVVNSVIKTFGKPDEVRIELARDLKKSAKERAEATEGISKATKAHDKIRVEIARLPQFSGGVRITRNDITRFKLWQELESNGYKTLYSGQQVKKEEIFSKKYNIEHIIPKALLFDDSFSNKTLERADVNLAKSSQTAYDFMESGSCADLIELDQYEKSVNHLYKEGRISRAKRNKLLMKASEIGDGFIERDLRNTQYIAKKAQEMLREVIREVTPTTGGITDRLRQDWQLINVLKEINLPIYEKLGLTHEEKTKDGKIIKLITDWSKRNDQRHHAMDALTVAFTKPVFIQYLNHLNARKDEKHKKHGHIIAIENKYTHIEGKGNKGKRLISPPMPLPELRAAFKQHLETVFISYKTKNKVVTKNVNRSRKGKNGKYRQSQKTLTPRGGLHKETVYAQSWHDVSKDEKVGTKFDANKILMVANHQEREALQKRLAEYQGNPKKAFGGKNAHSKNPIYLDNAETHTLPEKVTLVWQEQRFTIRKPVSKDLNIGKVTDAKIKKLLEQRLAQYGGDAKKAFANLEENPIWQNEEKGIAVKSVTITGVQDARPLHYQKDHHGKYILDDTGKPIPTDFIQTGNNHHVAIYSDPEGNLHETVVSLFDAVERVNAKSPIINKDFNKHIGWEFLYSMKVNEMFIFPNEETGFDPHQINLDDPLYYAEISQNLYRVQKISSKDYNFRHHLETIVQRQTKDHKKVNENPLKDIIWKRIRSMGALKEANPLKVRLNHLGEIVHVGEY